MTDLVCADCGKKAALKRKEHYFYKFIILLEEHNKQLVAACKIAQEYATDDLYEILRKAIEMEGDDDRKK